MIKRFFLFTMLLVSVYTSANSGSDLPQTTDLKSVPPVVKITSPKTGDLFKVYKWINVDAEASDADGNVKLIEFFFDGKKVAVDSVSPYLVAFVSYDPVPNGILKVIATDNEGMTSADSVTISVAFNKPPVITITHPLPSSVIFENELVMVEADITDPDGNILAADFDIEGEVTHFSAPPYRVPWKAKPGATVIKITALDDDFLQVSKAIDILVSKPTFYVDIKKPFDGSTHTTGDPVSIEATVNALKKVDKVDFFENESFIASDSVAPYQVTWVSKTGVNLLKAVALSDGKKVAGSILVNVHDPAINQLPVVRIMDHYNGSVHEADTDIRIEARASDADGSVRAVEFFVNHASVGIDSVAPYELWWKAVKGMTEIRAIATDNKGAKSKPSDIYRLYIDNAFTSRIIKIVEPSNGFQYKTGSTVKIEAFTSGRKSTYERSPVQFFVNNVQIGVANEYPYTVDWVAVKGKATIKAVSQNFWDDIVDSVQIEVGDSTQNRVPRVDIIHPQNNFYIDPGQPLSIEAFADDLDGVVSSVSFYTGNTLIGTDNTPPYNTTWTAAGNGQVTIRVVATDNLGGIGADSFVINVIKNVAPVVKITSPKDGHVINDGSNSVLINVSATDPVGIVTNVKFYINNKLYATDSEAPYLVSWPLLQNGDVFIKAVATDEKGLTSADSITIHVNLPIDPGFREVRLISPLHFESFQLNEVVKMEATVTAPASLKPKYVEFRINDSIRIFDSIAPYAINWPATIPGINKIFVFGFHESSSGSTIILGYDSDTIFVRDKTFDVKIISPDPASSEIWAYQPLTIEATAGDSKNKITQVEFFADGVSVGIDQTAPYNTIWEAKKGRSIIIALATNDKGEQLADTIFIKAVPESFDIQIKSPYNGQTYKKGDLVPITASVQNIDIPDFTLYNVEFFVNGLSIGMQSLLDSSIFKASWIAEKGYAIIKAVAWRGVQQIYITDSVFIKIAGEPINQAPVVKITNPANGEVYKVNEKISIQADASDADGTIKYVAFFVGNTPIGVDSVAPYTVDWSSPIKGDFTITAKAADNLAAIGTSDPVEITITIISGMDAEVEHPVSVYPNPVASVLNIETPENVTVQLLGVDGKSILMQGAVNAGRKYEIQLGTIANGSYVLRIFNDQFVSFRKIVISK